MFKIKRGLTMNSKKKKAPIGIIDGGIEGINIFEKLSKKYPNEMFIYINDLANYPYEEKDDEIILANVTKNINILLTYEVSLIIVVNNSIIEYCDEYLKTLPVPVVKINEVIIDYVNTNYEHKNVLLLAKQYLIKANLYQKNIKYNHLYNVSSDELEKIIIDKKVKTAVSFSKLRELMIQSNCKDLNILVIIDSYLSNLRIEFNEYISCNEIIDLPLIVGTKIEDYLDHELKNRKKSLIICNYSKKDFTKYVYWLNCKYKYLKLTKKVEDKILRSLNEEKKKEKEIKETIAVDNKNEK